MSWKVAICVWPLSLLACEAERKSRDESGGDADSTANSETTASGLTVPHAASTGTMHGSGSTTEQQAVGDASSDNPSGEWDAGGVAVETSADEPTPSSTTTDASPTDPSETSADAGGTSSEVVSGEPIQAELRALPSVRQEHGVVALEGELYVLGGFTPDVTSSVQVYSPATDAWRDVAEFPETFHHPNVAAVGGKIYVTGFLLGASLRNGDGRVFSYAPEQDAWSEHTPMSPGTERGSACVAALGSKIYVFGGASSNTLPDVSAYDTEQDSWEELPFMPELREHCVAAAVGDRIYIVSGRANGIGGLSKMSYEFDPESRTYEERSAIPTARGGTAGAVLGGRIFVFGGEGNDESETGIFVNVEAYDPASDTWQTYPDMLLPRHGLGAATIGSRIYLPGGGDVQGFGSVDIFTSFYFE